MTRVEDKGRVAWRRESVRSAAEMGRVIDDVAAAMDAAGYPARDVFAVRLALDEAVANAVKHGHLGDASKPVRVRYRVGAGRTLAEVEDQGPGFDPAGVPDPTAEENLGRPSGRGLFLMRAYLTWCRHSGRGNRVTLCKHRSPA